MKIKTVFITGVSSGLGLELHNLFQNKKKYLTYGTSSKKNLIKSVIHLPYSKKINTNKLKKIRVLDYVFLNSCLVKKNKKFPNFNHLDLIEILKSNIIFNIDLLQTLKKLKKININSKIVFISSRLAEKFEEDKYYYSLSKGYFEHFLSFMVNCNNHFEICVIRPGAFKSKLRSKIENNNYLKINSSVHVAEHLYKIVENDKLKNKKIINLDGLVIKNIK